MEPDDGVEHLRQLVEPLTATDSTLLGEALDRAYRVTLAVDQVLRDKCARIISATANRPVLYVYQSDGWSVRLSYKHTMSSSGETVVRETRLRRENLLERGLVRTTRPCGKTEFCVLLGPPRSLIHGRSAWHVFAAATEFDATLRSQQHVGVAIHIYLMDGCATMLAAQDRLEALHEMYYTDFGPLPVEERWALRHTEWVIPIRCVVHAAHLGVKWGLGNAMTAAISEDAHVALRGVINSSESLFEKMDEFSRRFIVFEDRGHDVEQLRQFWTMVDIPANLIELFILADPWWDPVAKLLKLQPCLEQDPECWDKISLILMTVRRWILWSDTRWARCGRAGRPFFVLSELDSMQRSRHAWVTILVKRVI